MTDEIQYRQRVLAGIIASLLICLLLVKFWPVREVKRADPVRIVFNDPVLIDDVEITRHRSSPPAPAKPMLPQPVPDDVIVEDYIEVENQFNLPELPALPEGMGRGLEGEDVIVSNPQLPPSVVRIVEPSVPELPEELRGRIEMVVNFLVDREGRVEEASIVEIRQYEDRSREEYEVLPFIQYGLMAATLEAAFDWRFRAARHEGTGVRTYTTASFHY